MQDVMVDLETLGRRAGCAVLSIGAVAFDGKGLGEEFYMVASTDSCTVLGLHVDPETLKWWESQSKEAKQVLLQAQGDDVLSLTEVLEEFALWLMQFDLKKVRIWGNGSDFDNAILTTAYAAIGRTQPWEFWNNRCYRTLKGLHPTVKLTREGTHHNALDDAKTQAKHAIELLRRYHG